MSHLAALETLLISFAFVFAFAGPLRAGIAWRRLHHNIIAPAVSSVVAWLAAMVARSRRFATVAFALALGLRALQRVNRLPSRVRQLPNIHRHCSGRCS
jgi:hypothetical protein